ncbi:MAG: M55 family metallopeptidase [Candidatus Bipolaricaulis sp.]|nr:M55 family metallopeptidase [Candidatus Bipolaricaulis sp.]
MKVYIAVDLEGVAGVVSHSQQCQWNAGKGWRAKAPETPTGWYAHYYEQARRLATEELNAAVQGAIDTGATEVWAWSGHGSFPGAFDIELVHPECRVVYAGEGGPMGHDRSFDALFMIGQHAMAGAPYGRLTHSFRAGIVEFSVNGRPWGETAATAFEFGRFGVPFALLSGDQAACDEAKALVPDVVTVPVMRGLTPKPNLLEPAATVCLSPRKARERIREAAAQAVKRCPALPPFVAQPPFTMRTTFERAVFADHAMTCYEGLTRVDETTVEKTADEVEMIL